MGILVTVGNSYVIITTMTLLKKMKSRKDINFQHFIVLNISIADFIMGIYLITIASFDASFSGIYGAVDRKWRSSLQCSIIGSLAVISSEASCFLMLVLTGFRLKNIINAIASLTASLRPWKICIFAAWLFSVFFGIVPILPQASQYFYHSFSYSTSFPNGTWYLRSLEQFACRLSALRNTAIEFAGDKCHSVKTFLASNSLNNASLQFFGYYGETSVSMPRFYVGYGENSWQFTLAVITISFLTLFS